MLTLAALGVTFVRGLRAGRALSSQQDRSRVRPERVDVWAAVGDLGDLENILPTPIVPTGPSPQRVG